jgi:hypothetical protein
MHPHPLFRLIRSIRAKIIRMKIETITGGQIGNMSIFGCPCCGPTRTDILRISEADLRDYHELCVRAVDDALRRLPDGFYTLVQHDTGYVQYFWLSKRGRVRLTPHAEKITNPAYQQPCLRIEVG